MRRRAGRYLADAMRGIRQAPVEVVATLWAAIAFSVALEMAGDAMRYWMELAVTCVLIVAVAWTGTLLHALGRWDATRRWVFTAAGAAVVGIYGVAVADFEYEGERWRALLLAAAAVLWLFAVPAFAGARENAVERMRRVDGRILLRMIGALLYGLALFAGLALALRAVTVLFELEPHNEIYGHVWGWIFFVLVPWIVLGGLQDYVRPAEATNQVARVAHRIALYLLPLLLTLYGLILYAYVIRIVITGEMPKNLVSPLVLAAGALGALALVVFDPRPGAGPLARWLRVAPVLFLPLAPLGAWALLVRIGQYGWTEFRVARLVVLAAFAGLAVAAAVQLVRRRPFALHVAPTALALVLLVSAIGPWSALAVARESQQELLVDALQRADVAVQDSTFTRVVEPDSAREIESATYEQIRGSSQYLARHFGPGVLPPVLQRMARREDSRWLDYAAELGLRPDSQRDHHRMALGGTLPLSMPVEVAGGTAYRIEWMAPERAPGRTVPVQPPRAAAVRAPAGGPATGAHITSIALQDSTLLALRVGERVLHAELAPLLGSMRVLQGDEMRERAQDQLPLDQAVLPVTDTAGVPQGELIVWHLWAETDSAGLHLRRIEGLLVVR